MKGVVLVTGASGYLGSAVAEEFLRLDWSVRALVRDAGRLPPELRGRVDARTGDLGDRTSLRTAMDGVAGVIHVAGVTADWVPDPSVFEQVNVAGTRNVLEVARELHVPRILATSSVMVFGPTDGLDVADERTRPPSRAYFLEYQVAKAKALGLCRAARRQGSHVAVVFPGALYGAGPLTDGNYLARVMEMLATGGYPVLPRTAGLRWCLAHVRDVARGHALAFDRGDPDGEWILGGDNVAFDRMLEIIRDGLALPDLPTKVPGGLMVFGLRFLAAWHGLWGSRPPMSLGGAQALLHDWAFSSAKAARELGYAWQPFDRAFPEFVSWYERSRAARPRPHAAHAHA